MTKIYNAIGFMSGTSADGVDIAHITSDGYRIIEMGPFETFHYPKELTNRIIKNLGKRTDLESLETRLTKFHSESLEKYTQLHPNVSIDLIGFPGQTITHNPSEKYTLQIGNPQILAEKFQVPVVYEFRKDDVKNGGEGAPLVPVYHSALMLGQQKPLAILNVGGVANITLVLQNQHLLAFDTGPGMGMLNDWMWKKTHKLYDKNGETSLKGNTNLDILQWYISDPYFQQLPPKSLDRLSFPVHVHNPPWNEVTIANGAHTLVDFSATAVKLATQFFPEPIHHMYVSGGGRKNKLLMDLLHIYLKCPVENIDVLHLNGDGIEAQAFAFLAIRRMNDAPASFPTTTGCHTSTVCGSIYTP